MTTTPKLTDTQRDVITLAPYRPDGNIEPLLPNLRGGARIKVIDGLLTREMIVKSETFDGDAWFLTDAAWTAVGRTRPEPEVPIDPEIEAAITLHEEKWQAEKQEAANHPVGITGTPRTRQNSKQATVIQMLQRPEGTTIAQVTEATGWQAHTVRGTFAGAFKKKMGMIITSEKSKGGQRVYHAD